MPSRKGGGGAAASSEGKSSLGGLEGLFGRSKLQDLSDKSGLAALTPHAGGGGGADEVQAAAAAGGPDLQVFAQMLEDAAARAQTAPPDQAIQLSLNDAQVPLQGVTVARLPDDTLSMTLQATPGAVTEVTRTLEALRRRLEARGVTLGELKLAEEGVEGPTAAPGAGET